MSGEWWHRMSASLDQDPRVVEAGWQATAVLGVLLRINAANRFDGLLPTRYCADSYVARFGNMPPRVVREAMVRLGEANLTMHNSEGLLLNVDETMTHGVVPVRDRVRSHRERLNDSDGDVTPSNATKRDVTQPLVDADAEEMQSREEKKLPRAKRSEGDADLALADTMRASVKDPAPTWTDKVWQRERDRYAKAIRLARESDGRSPEMLAELCARWGELPQQARAWAETHPMDWKRDVAKNHAALPGNSGPVYSPRPVRTSTILPPGFMEIEGQLVRAPAPRVAR